MLKLRIALVVTMAAVAIAGCGSATHQETVKTVYGGPGEVRENPTIQRLVEAERRYKVAVKEAPPGTSLGNHLREIERERKRYERSH